MMELADIRDLKSLGIFTVRVQISLSPPFKDFKNTLKFGVIGNISSLMEESGLIPEVSECF